MDLVQAVRESYDRCSSSGDFPATFYEVFFTKSSEIPELFKDTDFTQQKRHFRAALLILIKHEPGDESTRSALEKIGKTHSRGEYNIRPNLYPLFVESVGEAVRKHDPEWTTQLADQWVECIQDGVELIKSIY